MDKRLAEDKQCYTLCCDLMAVKLVGTSTENEFIVLQDEIGNPQFYRVRRCLLLV